MPNYCTNSIEIGHKDEDTLLALTREIAEHGFCQTIVPLEEWSYDQAVIKWGTKWDLDIEDDVDDPWVESTWKDGDVTWVGTFANSAWGPPVEVLEALAKKGFEVKAWWWEPGCEVIGQYETLDGESMLDEWSDLDDFLGVKDQDYVNPELRNYIEEDVAMWQQDELESN